MAAARWLRRPPRWFVLLLIALGIEAIYVFIISAGTFTTWPTWNANYNHQAEGFRAGHLYLTQQPSPELLAQPNPYDWSNVRLWWWDASLYKGRYYLYWGPFPALVLAAYKTIFRIKYEIGDQYLVFAFYTLHLIAGVLLIDRMSRRLFPRLHFGLVALGVAVFALANPTPYIVATPGVYQGAIIGAQSLMLLGIVFAFDAVWKGFYSGVPRRLLLVAGISWALAIACRVSAGPPVLLLCLATAIVPLFGVRPKPWRLAFERFVWVAGPVTIGVAALLLYNKLRFEAWFEFGVTYQLNTLPFLISKAYLPLNIYSYLLRPMGWSCRFPFVTALREIGLRGFPEGTVFPPGYATPEPLAGLFPTAPWTALVLLVGPIGLWYAVRHFRDRDVRRPLDARAKAEIWCVASLATIGTVTLLPVVAGFSATMRYLADISTGLVLLAVWTSWALLRLANPRRWLRRTLTGLLVLLGVATVVLGLLLGVQGYDDTFKRHNPDLYERMQRSFSLCSR